MAATNAGKPAGTYDPFLIGDELFQWDGTTPVALTMTPATNTTTGATTENVFTAIRRGTTTAAANNFYAITRTLTPGQNNFTINTPALLIAGGPAGIAGNAPDTQAAPALAVAPVFQPNTNQRAFADPETGIGTYEMTLSVTEPAGQIFQRWEIDWGDGTPQTPDIQYSCDATADMTHSYAISTNVDAQRFNIDVSALDSANNSTGWHATTMDNLAFYGAYDERALPAHAPG